MIIHGILTKSVDDPDRSRVGMVSFDDSVDMVVGCGPVLSFTTRIRVSVWVRRTSGS